MFDNVNWDCYTNPPEDEYEQEPVDEEEDNILFEDAWLIWLDDNRDWLDYLEKNNG